MVGDPTARITLARYREASLGDRVHVHMRWRSCPVAMVAAEVPLVGRVLDVGCGHGLVSHYLADGAAGREVVGVDIDQRKVAVAAATPSDGRVRFTVAAPGELPEGPFDAVVIVDVLYLLDDAGRDGLVATAASRLAPGGVLVVKEVGTAPRWKATVAAAQERLSTGVLGITAGSHHGFDDLEQLGDRLRRAGLDTTTRRLDAGRLHPHVLAVGRAPDTGGQAHD